MSGDWPTRDEDLNVLADVIDKHSDMNDGEPLGLFDIYVRDGERVDIQMSDWVAEVAEALSERHGLERGTDVMKHVLSQCLIGDSILH